MKRSVKMLLLLAGCALLIGGYALIQSANRQQAENGVDKTILLTNASKQDLAGIAWEMDGERLDFSRGADGQWVKTDDAAFPVNQDALDDLTQKTLTLPAVKKLEGNSDPADFGLDAPSLSVTLRFADQGETRYALGGEAPFSEGYYIGVSGRDSGVYVIAKDLKADFDTKLTAWAAWENAPRIPNVTRMTLGAAWDVLKDEHGVWHNAETGEMLETAALEKMATAAKRVAWNELVAVNADAETLFHYRLDDAQAMPLTLFDGEDRSVTLLLGGWNAGLCYARLPESRMVYTVKNLDAVIMANMNTLYRKDPFHVLLENASAVSFTAEAATWMISRAADAEGEEGAAYLLNGKAVAAGTAEGILARCAALAATGRVEVQERQDALLTIRITDQDGTASEVALTPYDADSCFMPVHENTGLLFPARDVEGVMQALRQAN